MSTQPPLSAYLHDCLYFTAGALSRVVGRMADEAFAGTGLSPAHAFLMMLVNERPGTTQKDLAQALHLAPSTVTRFVDSLAARGYVLREARGKLALVSPTDAGRNLAAPIARAWETLYHRYSDILGEQQGRDLTALADDAARALEENR